ncbi:hypothetical protein CINTURNW_1785 [Clostridium intestinale URNW]|uniref:Uncharacterized protein n=1 Tax=Clostridium intestinale URNW TaxID=1294142 RepID=U2PUU5_9CLOT|nr:hypothetical protein CINTURNW_1785 [Clostridium intestinale URNW]
MRTIFFLIVILTLYFGLSTFLSINLALLLFSLFFIITATIFLVRKDSYTKYIEFINPKLSILFKEKDNKFKKNTRITDIAVFYFLSAILLFISKVMPKETLPYNTQFIPLIFVAIIISICLYFLSNYIFKKSKNNSSYWFYFIGLLSLMILLCYLVITFVL